MIEPHKGIVSAYPLIKYKVKDGTEEDAKEEGIMEVDQ